MSSRWPLFAVVLAACVPDAAPPDPSPHDEWDDKLAARVIDYNAALRTASLKLVGSLPSIDEQLAVTAWLARVRGQRVWNLHPVGNRAGLGTFPGIEDRRRAGSRAPSASRGMLASNAFV